AHRRDRSVQPGSLFEILRGLGPEEITAVAFTAILEAERSILALQIVDRRHRARGVAERGMGGDVVHALRADIDDAAVAQRLEVLSSCLEHSSESRAGCSRRGK